MSYIYRYELGNKNIKQATDLSKWEKEILKCIEELFNENLKDSRVTERFFEFKLYEAVENKVLRELGKKLKDVIYQIKIENKGEYNINKLGFSRIIQEFYFIEYLKNYEDDESIIEIIDVSDFEDKERFFIQANKYIKKYKQDNKIKDNIEIFKEMYRDILYSRDKFIDYNKSFEELYLNRVLNKDKRYFKVRGYHRVLNNERNKYIHNKLYIKLNNFNDVKYLEYINENEAFNMNNNYLEVIEYK